MQSSTQTAPVPQGTAPSTALLRTRALTKEFRGFAAVDGVDLDVAEGSVHALVGPNGAGKTTLFNLLTGFLPPTSGTIELGERDVTGLPPERVARLGVARSFQITSLFAQLSLASTSSWRWRRRAASAGGSGARQKLMRRYRPRAMELLGQVGLADRAGVLAGALAYGRKRALELALALALDPKVLLLDEPTAGMGMEDVDRTVALIRRVASGRTVVMVEHNMHVVGSLADRVTVLQSGQGARRGPVRAGARRRAGDHRLPGLEGATTMAEATHRGPCLRLVRRGPGAAGRRPERAARRGGHARRPQRRRQVHPAALRDGPAPASGARCAWTAPTSPGVNPDGRARRGLGWVPDDRGIYATLSVAENLLLPPVAVPESAWTLEQVYEAFPALHERRELPRHQAVRRRAADARPGPGAADGRPAAALRRADRGALPGAGAAGRRRSPRDQGARGPRCCWSSRTCTSPPSPTGTTCWRRAGSRRRWTTPRWARRELLAYLGIRDLTTRDPSAHHAWETHDVGRRGVTAGPSAPGCWSPAVAAAARLPAGAS